MRSQRPGAAAEPEPEADEPADLAADAAPESPVELAPGPVPSVPPAPGIRALRVRATLADGREFVSAATFVGPADPNAPAAKDE